MGHSSLGAWQQSPTFSTPTHPAPTSAVCGPVLQERVPDPAAAGLSTQQRDSRREKVSRWAHLVPKRPGEWAPRQGALVPLGAPLV